MLTKISNSQVLVSHGTILKKISLCLETEQTIKYKIMYITVHHLYNQEKENLTKKRILNIQVHLSIDRLKYNYYEIKCLGKYWFENSFYIVFSYKLIIRLLVQQIFDRNMLKFYIKYLIEKILYIQFKTIRKEQTYMNQL
ncbi:unnamed protein product [Paramecium sonneborni]|uniref:Uncharacterized protein n=1 Tax=Paramecium sonneborni TaxID=65129 RepID=A0A8S1R6P3_9CILI|nr:unnamed protein product [Paramecium sonneborni]